MILSVFITVISGHDKPQPPGCLLGDDNGRPKLVTPPPVPGDYLHKEQLTDDEKEWAKRR
ncbi:hypothetical protein E2060_24700 [Escherichia coli]|nr:hypothetical protein [Escherichia coli]